MILHLNELLQKYEASVSLVLIDLAEVPDVTHSFVNEYPRTTSPHMHAIIPFALQGEPGVLEYMSDWKATSILGFLQNLTGYDIPHQLEAEAVALDEATEALSDCLFGLEFVDGHMPPEILRKRQGQQTQKRAQHMFTASSSMYR